MLIVHVFVSYAHANLCHFFSSSWCRGLAAASACGSSWTFLFIFLVIFSLAFSTQYIYINHRQSKMPSILFDIYVFISANIN